MRSNKFETNSNIQTEVQSRSIALSALVCSSRPASNAWHMN